MICLVWIADLSPLSLQPQLDVELGVLKGLSCPGCWQMWILLFISSSAKRPVALREREQTPARCSSAAVETFGTNLCAGDISAATSDGSATFPGALEMKSWALAPGNWLMAPHWGEPRTSLYQWGHLWCPGKWVTLYTAIFKSTILVGWVWWDDGLNSTISAHWGPSPPRMSSGNCVPRDSGRWRVVCVIGNPVPGQGTRSCQRKMGCQGNGVAVLAAGIHCLSTKSERATEGTTKKEI